MVLSSVRESLSIAIPLLVSQPSDIRLYPGCPAKVMQLIPAPMHGHQCILADPLVSVIQGASQDCAPLTLQKDLAPCYYL